MTNDNGDKLTTKATADNIEPLNIVAQEEENEVSLDGFGSASMILSFHLILARAKRCAAGVCSYNFSNSSIILL